MKSQGTSYWIPLMCTASVTDRPRAVLIAFASSITIVREAAESERVEMLGTAGAGC
jgi:hypothetical protein